MDYKQKFCPKKDYKNSKYAHKITYTDIEDIKEHFDKKTELFDQFDLDALENEFKISDTVILVGETYVLYATNLKAKSNELVNVLTFPNDDNDVYECVIV